VVLCASSYSGECETGGEDELSTLLYLALAIDANTPTELQCVKRIKVKLKDAQT
jgi:hypothetical protein